MATTTHKRQHHNIATSYDPRVDLATVTNLARKEKKKKEALMYDIKDNLLREEIGVRVTAGTNRKWSRPPRDSASTWKLEETIEGQNDRKYALAQPSLSSSTSPVDAEQNAIVYLRTTSKRSLNYSHTAPLVSWQNLLWDERRKDQLQ